MRHSNRVDAYYRPGRPKPLTIEQENALAARIAQGDQSAVDELVGAHLRLAPRVAQAYLGQGLDIEDLIGAGNFAIVHAALRFDPRKGARFATYAKAWIRSSLKNALRRAPGVGIGKDTWALLSSASAARNTMRQNLAAEPTDAAIAAALGVSEKCRRTLARASAALHTAPASVAFEDGGSLAEVAEHAERQAPLSIDFGAIALTHNQRRVLSLRYGLTGARPMSQCQVAAALDQRPSWVARVEELALGKIRSAIERAVASRSE